MKYLPIAFFLFALLGCSKVQPLPAESSWTNPTDDLASIDTAKATPESSLTLSSEANALSQTPQSSATTASSPVVTSSTLNSSSSQLPALSTPASSSSTQPSSITPSSSVAQSSSSIATTTSSSTIASSSSFTTGLGDIWHPKLADGRTVQGFALQLIQDASQQSTLAFTVSEMLDSLATHNYLHTQFNMASTLTTESWGSLIFPVGQMGVISTSGFCLAYRMPMLASNDFVNVLVETTSTSHFNSSLDYGYSPYVALPMAAQCTVANFTWPELSQWTTVPSANHIVITSANSGNVLSIGVSTYIPPNGNTNTQSVDIYAVGIYGNCTCPQ